MSKPAKQQTPELFALPSSQIESIIPEIDNLEDEVIGEAVLKEFVPGSVYFDYQDILNNKTGKASSEETKRKAIYDAQVWLLCQVYEVVEESGKVRPLGLQDVSFMEGEELAFRIADIMSVNLKVNFLDEKESLETSWLFEVTEKAQRFRVHKLSVEKGVEIQQQSQKDPTGVKLTKWLIAERITLNDEKIKEEDFKDKLDFETTVLLASKINFLLAQFQRKGTSFSLRSTRAGRTPTSK